MVDPQGSKRAEGPCLLLVADQEAFSDARRYWPHARAQAGPNAHVEERERTARCLTEAGQKVELCFFHPALYRQWCDDTGCDPTSPASGRGYARAMSEAGLAVPYDPDVSIWALGLDRIVLRSDAARPLYEEDNVVPETVAEWLDALASWIMALTGQYRLVATVCRSALCDPTDLWAHFKGDVFEQEELHVCPGFIAYKETVEVAEDEYCAPRYGSDEDPLGLLCALGVSSGGIVAVEHRSGGQMSLRAWYLSIAGVTEVPAGELGIRLGFPDSPSLCEGLPAGF